MLVPLGAPRATSANFMVGKCALHVANTRKATPQAEDSCQSLMSSGTCRISLVMVSITVVPALFKDSDLATPRHASKRSSIEFRASSYASVLLRVDSLVHSKPRLAAKSVISFFRGQSKV